MAKGFNWRGPFVSKRVGDASAAAINETLGECVAYAKQNHPGWQNRTTTAEGSIRVTEAAQGARRGANIVGRWGSLGVEYMIYLEMLYGHALVTAADALYPTLAGRIARRVR